MPDPPENCSSGNAPTVGNFTAHETRASSVPDTQSAAPLPDQANEPPEIETHQDVLQKITAKEKAVKEALLRLRNIRRKVQEAQVHPLGLGLEAWNAKIDEIEQEDAKFQYIVGVGGDTGLGKTSLLNALLNPTSDIAPASQAGACTAAVCCFHFHEPEDKDKKFLAVARFKSKATVDEELKLFFGELKDFQSRSSPEDTRDSVHQGQAMKYNSQLKLIHGWSGLDIDDIRKLGLEGRAAEITTQCKESTRFFNLDAPTACRTEEVHHNKAPKFLKLVKPYVGGGRQKTQLLWPLVDVVHFYLNNDNVLRHGITLVDLPGEMDALESRSKVAHTYYRKVDQLMVVTPGDRAADNRTAMDLLREDQILDMDADGKTESLCVVITKVDLLNWVSFVENEWSPEEISEDFPALKERYDMLSKKVRRLTSRIERLRDEFHEDDIEDNIEDDSATEDDDSETHADTATLDSLVEIRTQLEKERSIINAECLRACVDARSRDSKIKFQEHFDMIRNANRGVNEPKVTTQLDVFPVSSLAQRGLASGQCMAGFENSEATGFKSLEEWLIKGSLRKREKQADRILHRSLVMFDSMRTWNFLESNNRSKLPESDLPKIKDTLGVYQKRFRRRLSRAQNELKVFIRDLPPNRLAGWDSINAELARGFVSHVRKYEMDNSGDDLHPATYRALIRRSGGAFRSNTKLGRRDHDWQSRIYTYYWRPYVSAWAEAFHEKLPTHFATWLRALDKMMVDNMSRIARSSNLPELYKATYHEEARRILNIFHDYRSRLEKAASDYQNAMASVKAGSRKLLNDEMTPAYAEAYAACGHRAMKQRMKEYAKGIRDLIFHDVSDLVAASMMEKLDSFVKEHEELDNNLVASLLNLETHIAESICYTEATRYEAVLSRRELSKLNDSLREEIVEWEVCWQSVAGFLTIPTSELPEDLTEVKLEIFNDSDGEELPGQFPSADIGELSSSGQRGEKRQAAASSSEPRKMPKIEPTED